MIAERLLVPLSWQEYLSLGLAVFGIRPIAIALAWIGATSAAGSCSPSAAFKPKGFASVVYGIYSFRQISGMPHISSQSG